MRIGRFAVTIWTYDCVKIICPGLQALSFFGSVKITVAYPKGIVHLSAGFDELASDFDLAPLKSLEYLEIDQMTSDPSIKLNAQSELQVLRFEKPVMNYKDYVYLTSDFPVDLLRQKKRLKRPD